VAAYAFVRLMAAHGAAPAAAAGRQVSEPSA
jgi:hypothetical protein